MERVHRHLIFLVRQLNCGIGGMETHQRAFIEFFCKSMDYIFYVVEKAGDGVNLYVSGGNILRKSDSYNSVNAGINWLQSQVDCSPVIFLNDFWWIEELQYLRYKFPSGKIIIRSGGNDIELAPWNKGNQSFDNRLKSCLGALYFADSIVVNSRFSSQRFISKGLSPHQMQIIRGGVDKAKCDEVLKNKNNISSQLRCRFGIEAPLMWIFACRMVPFKGISLALQAVLESGLRNKVHLLFVGDGELEDNIKKFCVANKLNASFLGAQPNRVVLQLIGGSDLLINTSLELLQTHKGHRYMHTETMGRSMMEAISVHTPILATNVGGIPELFEENESIGVICEGTVEAIAKVMNSLPNTTFSFKQRINYAWDRVFTDYISIFNS